jgi:FKBP-type peptidyl-prolyl cis-trans isomerase FkpA
MTSRIPLFVLLAAVTVWGCSPDGGSSGTSGESAADDSAAATGAADEIEITPGLTMKKLNNGYGRAAVAGDLASVHYTGWLYDPNAADGRGKKFDSSVDRGQPFQFPLGAGRVIRGWDEGVVGMLIGEKRELRIAPELGYGARGAGSAIPPGATLLFEVELLGLRGPNDE